MAGELRCQSNQRIHGNHFDLQKIYPLSDQMKVIFEACSSDELMKILYVRAATYVIDTYVSVPLPKGEFAKNSQKMALALEEAWKRFEEKKTPEQKALAIGGALLGRKNVKESFETTLRRIHQLK